MTAIGGVAYVIIQLVVLAVPISFIVWFIRSRNRAADQRQKILELLERVESKLDRSVDSE